MKVSYYILIIHEVSYIAGEKLKKVAQNRSRFWGRLFKAALALILGKNLT